MNITKFFKNSLLQRFGPQGSGGYYLDQIEGSTNKVRVGGRYDYNINTNGTLDTDYATDNSGKYLDEDFTSVQQLFDYLNFGDDSYDTIITDTVLQNLLYTASGKKATTKFSSLHGGDDTAINTVNELKQALIFIEIFAQKDVFKTVQPLSATPLSPTTPSQSTNNYNELPIKFTYTESDTDEDGGSTTDQNAIALKKIFDDMYNADADFRDLIEAVKQKHGKFEVKVMELKESDTFGEAYTGEYRLWINNHVLTNAITNPTGGIEEFEGGLSENNLQKLQGTIVHETLHVLGLHHDSRNGRPGINALEYVPWGTDNIFYDTLNGIDDGRTVNNYIF